MIVVGEYGVGRWDVAADEYRLPPNPPEISAVTDELPKILDSLGPGEALIEDKGRAVAVHTRSLPDPKGLVMILVISRPFAPYASWGTTGWQDCSCVLPRTRRMR